LVGNAVIGLVGGGVTGIVTAAVGAADTGAVVLASTVGALVGNATVTTAVKLQSVEKKITLVVRVAVQVPATICALVQIWVAPAKLVQLEALLKDWKTLLAFPANVTTSPVDPVVVVVPVVFTVLCPVEWGTVGATVGTVGE